MLPPELSIFRLMVILDGFLEGLSKVQKRVTSQERRATQTDVCLTYALNRSVLQTMMVFHSQQNTFYRLIRIYQHIRISTAPYEKSDEATS